MSAVTQHAGNFNIATEMRVPINLLYDFTVKINELGNRNTT